MTEIACAIQPPSRAWIEQALRDPVDALPPEMRQGRLERSRATTRFDPRLAEEASCRP
ncbi:MAG: hypothetical protein IT374_23040 [Polyangiaceae bacterium]|nr:hypothetical protein [Polyangiaceae bacterium]